MNIAQTMQEWADAHDNGDWGHSSTRSVFYQNRLLYDYGTHYLMAYRGDAVTFVNGFRWSVTTTQHMGFALRAAQRAGHRIVAMPDGVDITDLRVPFRDSNLNGKGGLPFDLRDRLTVHRWAAGAVLEAPEAVAEVLAFFRMSRSFAAIQREAKRKADSEADRARKAHETNVRGFIKHWRAVRDYDRAAEHVATIRASNGVDGLQAESAYLLEAMRFAERKGYAKSTVEHLRNVRRIVRNAIYKDREKLRQLAEGIDSNSGATVRFGYGSVSWKAA